MIECTTIICILLLYYFHPGEMRPLNNWLVIERIGKYHVKLAAQLNLAQPLIEAIADQLGTRNEANNDSTTIYFDVREQQVTACDFLFYQMAITQRNGMLYFQVPRPLPQNQGSELQIISNVCNVVLMHFPSAGEYDPAADEYIIKTVYDVARLHGVHIAHRPVF